MTPLTIAEIMASAVFFTVGLIHIIIWARRPGSKAHLLFALFAIGAGASRISMILYYQATTVEAFTVAFKWNNVLSAIYMTSLTWFLVVYGESWPRRRWLPLAISAIFLPAAIASALLPYGFLYTEITGLRYVTLPWGEQFALAEGSSSLWRMTSYALLLVVLAMSYEMAADVVRASTLAEKVRANEQRWRTLLENVHLVVIGVGRDGRINYVNPHFTKVTDFTTEEVLEKPFTDLYAADLREGRQRLFRDAMEGRLRSSAESSLTVKSGEVRRILWSNVLLRDTEGDIAGILSIGADITEQRQAETARDQALNEVEKAFREVEKLKSRLEEEVVYLRDEIRHIGHFDEIVGQSDALKYVLHRVEMVAPQDTTVFIEGETGVGKELFARAIHRLSARGNRPLVKVNCAALPTRWLSLLSNFRGSS
jgi:PAS domain S-box-containing protein